MPVFLPTHTYLFVQAQTRIDWTSQRKNVIVSFDRCLCLKAKGDLKGYCWSFNLELGPLVYRTRALAALFREPRYKCKYPIVLCFVNVNLGLNRDRSLTDWAYWYRILSLIYKYISPLFFVLFFPRCGWFVLILVGISGFAPALSPLSRR